MKAVKRIRPTHIFRRSVLQVRFWCVSLPACHIGSLSAFNAFVCQGPMASGFSPDSEGKVTAIFFNRKKNLRNFQEIFDLVDTQ